MTAPSGSLAFVLAGIVACATCVAIAHAGETRVALRIDERDRLQAAVAADDGLERQRASFARRYRLQRGRLHSTLRPIDTTARVASFVRDAARISAAHRTAIAAIVPAASVRVSPGEGMPPHPPSGPASPSSAAAAPGLTIQAHDDVGFDVTLDGRYSDVLATIRGLASLTLPAAIELLSIARRSPGATDPSVQCAIRVTLRDVTVPDGPQ